MTSQTRVKTLTLSPQMLVQLNYVQPEHGRLDRQNVVLHLPECSSNTESNKRRSTLGTRLHCIRVQYIQCECILISSNAPCVAYSIILLGLTPNDFTRKGESAATQLVN
jgi:hypothetical protein